jgi:CheY-like chemotaxis protein
MRIANEKALSKAGYSVVTAGDGEEALCIAFERIPDLILLDMLLPKLGGLEVLLALRKNPDTASIPVVVMSSLSQKNDEMLIKAGANAYIEKSKMEFDQNAESLLAIVQKTLDLVPVGKPETDSVPVPDPLGLHAPEVLEFGLGSSGSRSEPPPLSSILTSPKLRR